MKQIDPHIKIQRQHLIDNLGRFKLPYIYMQAKSLGIYDQICSMIGTPESNNIVIQNMENKVIEPREYPNIERKSRCSSCRRSK